MAKNISIKNLVPKNFGLLNNRFLLYGILVAYLLDMYYLYSAGEGIFVLLLILIGIITSFFSKNMIVILVIALVITNAVKAGNGIVVNEGFKGKKKASKKSKKEGLETGDNAMEEEEGEEEVEDVKKVVAPTKKISDLNKETTDLVENQNKLMDNMDKLGPLLDRAEKFIQKYESMKNKEGMKAKN